MFAAAALALTLFSCKNDATTGTKTGKDTTAAADEGLGGEEAMEGEDAEEAAKDAAPKEGEVLLRLNYPKGYKQQLNYIVDTKGNAMNGTIAVAVAYVVSDVAAGAAPQYTFTGQITGLKMKYDAQGQKMDYDSGKKTTARTSEMEKKMDEKFREIEGQPLSFALNNRGKVVKDMQFTGKAAGQDLPFDINSYQVQFPAEPVSVGSAWTNESADKQVGGKRTNTYTVKEINDATVVLGVKSVLPAPQMKGAQPSVFTGSYTVDRKTGMLINGSIGGNVETMGATVTMTFTGKEVK